MANDQIRVRLSASDLAYLKTFAGKPGTAISILIHDHKRMVHLWESVSLFRLESSADSNEPQSDSKATQPISDEADLVNDILADLEAV